MARIFISYKRADKDKVFPIVAEIKQKTGVDCWIDLEGIESGDQFQNVIIDAIDNADTIVFMLSKNFVAPYKDEKTGKIDLKKQTFPEKEIMYALDEGKRLVPLSIDGTTVKDCKWLKFNCSGLDCIDWYKKEEKDKFVKNILQWCNKNQINNDSQGLVHELPNENIDEEGRKRKSDENLSNQINNYSRYLELIDEEGRKRKIEEQQHREELRIKKEKEERRIQQEEQARKCKIAKEKTTVQSTQSSSSKVSTNRSGRKSSDTPMKGCIITLAVIVVLAVLSILGSRDTSFEDASAIIPSGEVGSHEYVDLGLSVKWATCNIGADAPHKRGSYFAWGETESKFCYNWKSYKWNNGDFLTFSKYNDSFEQGLVDNKRRLEKEDDAAYVQWGSNWRMPTADEVRELFENCTWTKAKMKGVEGFLITSNVAGFENASIFIPLTGSRYRLRRWDKETCEFWTSSSNCNGACSGKATVKNFVSSSTPILGSNLRVNGLTVRPVLNNDPSFFDAPKVGLSCTDTILMIGEAIQMKPGLYLPKAYAQDIIWSSNDTSVVQINSFGRVVAVGAGKTFISACCGDVNSICEIKVRPYSGSINGHEYIDLGLPSGNLWSSYKMGMFAWGETKKDVTYPNFKVFYDWEHYKYYKNGKLIKYVTNKQYGKLDNLRTLKYEDDAARESWGGSWRIPSKKDWNELIENCSWIRTYIWHENQSGFAIIGKNGNKIFLGLCGINDGGPDKKLEDKDRCNYWSSNLSAENSKNAISIISQSGEIYFHDQSRYKGLSIRPVSSPLK